MRTTVDIDDDVLQAAKELATKEKSTAGRVISALARKALAATAPRKASLTKNAVPILRRRGDVITVDHVRKLMEQEGV
jgi:Arc/MetJ family transcription regulator